MKKPSLESLLEKLEALEKRVEALENAHSAPAGTPRVSVPRDFSAGATPNVPAPGAEEMTLVILADGRAWRSGKGHFYFSKKDGTEEVGSVGISLDKIGGQPLQKGDRIHITTSKIEDDNYRGEQRFQCFADTCEILNDAAPSPAAPVAAASHETFDSAPTADFVPAEPPPSTAIPVDEEEDDIPF